VLYNLVQEPWLKYCMSAIADRGLKSSHWTSSRLREDVLYLESSRWVGGFCSITSGMMIGAGALIIISIMLAFLPNAFLLSTQGCQFPSMTTLHLVQSQVVWRHTQGGGAGRGAAAVVSLGSSRRGHTHGGAAGTAQSNLAAAAVQVEHYCGWRTPCAAITLLV
jgi:hypothetical protein